MTEGILFVTYPTLRSARQDATRLQQILDWAHPTYEGVIAFDESHEMGGVAGGEGAMGRKNGSQQGVAGVLLQNHLPKARILYASATGASEVNNLAYAVGLACGDRIPRSRAASSSSAKSAMAGSPRWSRLPRPEGARALSGARAQFRGRRVRNPQTRAHRGADRHLRRYSSGCRSSTATWSGCLS